MRTLSIKVPEVLLPQSGGSVEVLTRDTQYLLALKLFEVGRLTSGQAAEMCGMNRVDFLLAIGRSGVPVADLDGEELADEIRNARGT